MNAIVVWRGRKYLAFRMPSLSSWLSLLHNATACLSKVNRFARSTYNNDQLIELIIDSSIKARNTYKRDTEKDSCYGQACETYGDKYIQLLT